VLICTHCTWFYQLLSLLKDVCLIHGGYFWIYEIPEFVSNSSMVPNTYLLIQDYCWAFCSFVLASCRASSRKVMSNFRSQSLFMSSSPNCWMTSRLRVCLISSSVDPIFFHFYWVKQQLNLGWVKLRNITIDCKRYSPQECQHGISCREWEFDYCSHGALHFIALRAANQVSRCAPACLQYWINLHNWIPFDLALSS
jgi:hypothetical protein